MIRTEPDGTPIDDPALAGVVAWLREGEIAIDVEPPLLGEYVSCGVTITPARARRLITELLALARGEGPDSMGLCEGDDHDAGEHEGVVVWRKDGKPSIDVATTYVVWVGVCIPPERVVTLAADLRELVDHVEKHRKTH